jgi:adenosylcobinamide kinase/adenosylcobinamide-phosphate guanylyltransferase
MTRGRLTLIGGGVRSGKSAFALEHARASGARRTLLATAEPLDGEMRARIEQHRRERGHDFATLEEPLAVPDAVRSLRECDVVVIDCATLWLSNLMLRGDGEARILAHADALCAVLADTQVHAIVVTSEVGMGIVPEHALSRQFRDLAGLLHQRLARAADEVFLAALGCVLRVRPAPVALVAAGGVRCGI